MKKMKKTTIVFLVILLVGFLSYQYYVYSTKKEMEKNTIEFLELHGESEDNIKEMKHSLVVYKGYQSTEIIFKDEENIKYAFYHLNNRNGISVNYSYAEIIDENRRIPIEKELKHQNLRSEEAFYLERK
jgi:Protein of unknown function (DUF3139)